MAARDDADRAKLHQISELSYKAQAIWFLNGFFDTHSGEAEKFWAYVEKAATLDTERRESGNGLDELNAHRLLEIFDETLTVREMRTQLRTVGALLESDRPKSVPLAHLLLARYKVDWHKFVNAPQGDSEELNRAQAKLDECKAAFEEANRRLAESRAAEAELAAKEAELQQAQAELDAALNEVRSQEQAYAAKTADLERKSEEGGVVSRNKAKNELAQHLAEDPLPLRKAKITLEAATKRNERALQAAQIAREAATRASEAAAAAVAAAERALQEAEEYLAEVSKNAGGGKGALWWIERELHEQRKYLPSSRGGIAKK